jgi:biopolymer transport protein ExbD
MPRVKIPRKSTAIDMTAMCDVAFLLLTFFILTAKPRTDDPVPVDIPASTQTVLLPEADVATLTVGQNKVFFGVEGYEIRKAMLVEMGDKHNPKMTFTNDEAIRFASLSSFGVPINVLHQFLALEPEQRKNYTQPGIPVDTTKYNELYEWVYAARVATKRLDAKEMRVSIKGDSKEEYPIIKTIISTLQKQDVNKFALITALRSAPK